MSGLHDLPMSKSSHFLASRNRPIHQGAVPQWVTNRLIEQLLKAEMPQPLAHNKKASRQH